MAGSEVRPAKTESVIRLDQGSFGAIRRTFSQALARGVGQEDMLGAYDKPAAIAWHSEGRHFLYIAHPEIVSDKSTAIDVDWHVWRSVKASKATVDMKLFWLFVNDEQYGLEVLNLPDTSNPDLYPETWLDDQLDIHRQTGLADPNFQDVSELVDAHSDLLRTMGQTSD